MRAAIARDYGDIDDVVRVVDDWPRPAFDAAKARGRALLAVSACALAPGDVRVLSGRTREVQGPPSLPYVPGGDVAGHVVQLSADERRLKIGDAVVAQFGDGPRDGLAQYCVVHTNMAVPIPKATRLSMVEAAALGSSGATAMVLARFIRGGERVLVLGASGGVGTTLLQLLKCRRVSFLAATTTQLELATSLGADRAIDYREENVWEMDEFKKEKFDVVFDLVEGGWLEAKKKDSILKRGSEGGRFITTVAPDSATFDVHSYWDMMKVFVFPLLARMLWTAVNWWRLPSYRFVLGLSKDRTLFTDLFTLIEEGKLRVVLDPVSPAPFTTEGVRRALRVQESRHAHGKVVVEIAAAEQEKE